MAAVHLVIDADIKVARIVLHVFRLPRLERHGPVVGGEVGHRLAGIVGHGEPVGAAFEAGNDVLDLRAAAFRLLRLVDRRPAGLGVDAGRPVDAFDGGFRVDERAGDAVEDIEEAVAVALDQRLDRLAGDGDVGQRGALLPS